MECKGSGSSENSFNIPSIDLTRMECKDAMPWNAAS